MMIERVIYCGLGSLAMLSPLPHETLLKRDDGVVAAVQDETVMVLLSRQAAVSLLYFSKDGYQHAIQGLNEQEVKEVIDLRLKKWAPESLNRAMGWLHLGQRQCLAWTVLAHSQASGINTQTLQTHADNALEFLARLTNESRYDDVKLTTFLVVALEKEAELLAELKDALANQAVQLPAAERILLEQEVRAREASAKDVAAMLTRRGSEDFRSTLPYVELVRAVCVRPRDAALVRSIKVEFEPYFEYEDALVCRQGARRMIELERAGKKISILYLNGAEFLESLTESTPAQLARDIKARSSASPDANLRSRRDFLCNLRLGQILLKKALRERALSEDRSVALELDGQIGQETTVLAAEIVKHRIWISTPATSNDQVRAELLRREEALLREVKLFESLAHHHRQDQFAKRFQSLALAKAADVARIKGLSENLR